MSVRISAVDWAPGGMEPEDAVEVARLLKAHGCDVVDVSAGQTVPDQRPVYGRLFQTPFADRIRHEVGMATMAVGNISSYTDVNTILAAGRADLCLLARAHLWDPYWTRHAAWSWAIRCRGPSRTSRSSATRRDSNSGSPEKSHRAMSETYSQAAVTYSSYLKLDELLSLQQPRSEGPEHDETLFIVIHQVYELWFKELLHELDYLRRLLEDDEPHTRAAHAQARC